VYQQRSRRRAVRFGGDLDTSNLALHAFSILTGILGAATVIGAALTGCRRASR
jgi:hypothetical protein